jgi:hypothetical protein
MLTFCVLLVQMKEQRRLQEMSEQLRALDMQEDTQVSLPWSSAERS